MAFVFNLVFSLVFYY